MPVNVKLSDNERYIIYDLTDPVNIQELMEAYKEEKTIRDSAPYTLHSIVDMSGIRRVPPNWLTAKAGPGLTHPRSGRMLFVGISPGLAIIVRTILKIARYNRMLFFNSREEAEQRMMQLVGETQKQNASTTA